MPELAISPMIVPATADAPDAADFRTLIDLRNADMRRIRGDDEHAFAPEGALPYWQDQADWRIDAFLAREGDEVVSSCSVEFGLDEGATAGGLNIRVRHDEWGRGIGSELLPFLEDRIREAGRANAQTWTEHPASPGDRINARTGFGSVPADHVARFLRRHGYDLEQVYRNSRLDITGDLTEAAALARDARSAAGTEYRVVSWEMPTPPEFIDDYAWMKSRMSTDAPNADLDVAEQQWDAERVRRLDARDAAGGFRRFTTAAQHVESGRLVAFTDLYVLPVRPTIARQDDTLVVGEHRGHRLGMLVKCAALAQLRDSVPEVRYVETFNAEENRPMLDINERMGFRPLLYAGEWQKRLA